MSIGEAAKVLGVSITMLRRWEAEGRLVAEHTPGGHRRYDLVKLRPEQFRAAQDATRKTIAYARVSRRTFHCDDCGYETGRDHNAARNLEKLAASSAVSACGEERSGAGRKPRVKRASMRQVVDLRGKQEPDNKAAA